ncbi:hypothetical protein [Hymenobacter rubidus]|uniref:hypothetical protein n=1 Tax=Hymenobacter rubidus TaxID=1441626 RepID=UPI00191F7F85|nr:hypothetical protein [Hymenobacter rubidus]
MIANPWQLDYTVWGSSALLNTAIYMAGFALFGGNAGIELGCFVGLVSGMVSLPAIVMLRWVMPRLLALKTRAKRLLSVMGLVVALFLLKLFRKSKSLSS